MYQQAEQLPQGAILQGYDICIVGAGAAGIAIAQRLAQSSLKVLLLVSGAPGDRGLPSQARQSLYGGTVGDFLRRVDPDFLQRSRLNMYGGTTNHFGFWARPLDAADMQPRPGYRDAGWPIDQAELQPYYVAAHEFGRFGPFNYDDMRFWERVLYARCFAALPGDKMTGAIMRAQYEENLHDFQVQFRRELEGAANLTVLFNAHLLSIETDENRRRVSELKCATIVTDAAGRGAAGKTFQGARTSLRPRLRRHRKCAPAAALRRARQQPARHAWARLHGASAIDQRGPCAF